MFSARQIDHQSQRHILRSLFLLHRNKTFRRFFILYVSILIVFLLLFSVFINITLSIITNKAIRVAQETMKSGLTRLEMTLASYQSTAMSLFNDDALSQLMAYSSYSDDINLYQAIKAKAALSDISANLADKSSCGLILKNGMVLTPTRFYTDLPSFYDTFFACDGFKEFRDWQAFILSNGNGTLLPACRYSEYGMISYMALTYAVWLPVKSTDPKILFFVTVKADAILSMLIPAGSLEYDSLHIFDRNGHALLLSGADDSTRSGKQGLRVTATGSSGLVVDLQLSYAALESELAPFRRFVLLFTLIYILVGIGLAIIIAYFSSQPVLRLLHAATSEHEPADADRQHGRPLTGEYQCILDALERRNNALKSYQQALNLQAQQMQYYILSSLLEGTVDPLESEDLTTRYFNSFWPTGKEPFFMFLIRIRTTSASDCDLSQPLVQSLLYDCLPPDSLHHLSRHPAGEQHEYESIVLVRADIADRSRDEYAAAIQAALNNLPETICRISVSDIRTGLREVRDTYMHLQHLLRLSGDSAAERIILWSATEKPEIGNQFNNPDSAWQNLPAINSASVYRLLVNEQFSTLNSLLDDCEAYIRRRMPDDENVICYVFYSCTSALYELTANIPALSDSQSHALIVPAYNSHYNLDKLFSQLRGALAAAFLSIRAYYSDSEKQHYREIVAFIDQNIDNSELYTKMVTDRFNIRENELQAIMRAISSLSFFSYVEKARMQKALRLICESDIPITKIHTLCGYNTRTTFFRAFQRNYGVSPQKMREGCLDLRETGKIS